MVSNIPNIIAAIADFIFEYCTIIAGNKCPVINVNDQTNANDYLNANIINLFKCTP